jgi:hypothetical protein
MTNEQAAEVIGKSWQVRRNAGTSIGAESFNISSGETESFDYDVPPQEFSKLRKGGVPNDLIVEAFAFQNGRVWKNGLTHLRVKFKQQ